MNTPTPRLSTFDQPAPGNGVQTATTMARRPCQGAGLVFFNPERALQNALRRFRGISTPKTSSGVFAAACSDFAVGSCKGVQPPKVALANEGEEKTHVLALENEEFAFSEDGWVKLSPYGDLPKTRMVKTSAGGYEVQRFIQRLDRAAAEAMVKRFNSFRGKLKRFIVGVPIYKRHPDLGQHSPETVASLANDKAEYGQFADLQAREDGFYGKPVMSQAGQAAIEKEGLKYLSPFWNADVVGIENEHFIAVPYELISAGLTDTPNIRGGEALANEKTKPKETMNKEQLIKLLASLGVALANEATDEQVHAAIKELHAKGVRIVALENEKNQATSQLAQVQTQLTDANTRVTSLTTALANERQSRIKLLVDSAVLEGRITEAERQQWTAALSNESEFEAKAAALANEKRKFKTDARTGSLGDRKSEVDQVSDLTNKVVALVNERMKNSGEDWDTAFRTVQAEKPDLFQQMKRPDQN